MTSRFDLAAVFLLDQQPVNLFEQADDSALIYRCKGCSRLVYRARLDAHHAEHREQLPELRALVRKADRP